MQETRSTLDNNFARKVVTTVLSLITLISGISFAAAAAFSNTTENKKVNSDFRTLHAFALPTIAHAFSSTIHSLPRALAEVRSLAGPALRSVPTDLASNTPRNAGVPALAFSVPSITPIKDATSAVVARVATIQFPTATVSVTPTTEHAVTLTGIEARKISVVGSGISLINEIRPSRYIPHLFTESTFAGSDISSFFSKVDFKLPRMAQASSFPAVGLSRAEGLVLGVSATSATVSKAKATLPFLDKLSLTLYCAFASASPAFDPRRCDYDTIASGVPLQPAEEVTTAVTTPPAPAPVAATSSLDLLAQSLESKVAPATVYITKYVTEYVPVVGPAGRDGADGRDGKNGTDGVATFNNTQAAPGFGSYIVPNYTYSSPATAVGISTIGYLKDTTIDTPVISGGTAANLYLTNSTIKNAVFNGLSLFSDPVSFTGDITVASLTATSSVFMNATTTNAYISNLFVAAATSTDSYISRLVAASSTLTDAMLTNSTTTNAYIASLVAASTTVTDLVVTNAAIENATTTNSYIQNLFAEYATTTNSYASIFAFSTSTGDTLSLAGAFTAGGLSTLATTTVTDFIAVNATTTNAYIENLIIGTTTSSHLVVNGDLSVTGTSTLATTTVTDLISGRATSTSLFASIFEAITGVITNLTATNATTTNFFTQNLSVGNSSIQGDQTVSGSFNVSGTSTLGSNVFMGGNVMIGTSSSEVLTVNALVNSNFTPASNKMYDLGTPSFYWRTLYADSINVNTISAASTTISGTSNNDFTINSDNASADTEDASLVFFRGLVNPNAVLRWNSVAKRFESNMSFLVKNETPSVGSTTLTVQAGQGQGVKNLFELLNSSGSEISVFNANGWLGIGSSTPGSALSVQGNGYFGGNVTATGTLTVTGAATSSFTGSVGIGTTTANTRFAIQNASTTLQDLLSFYRADGIRIGGFSNQGGSTSVFTWANNGAGAYNFTVDGNGEASALRYRASSLSSIGAPAPAFSFGSDSDSGMYSAAANTLGFSTAGINRLTIGSNGNVGIGVSTSTPTAMLTVSSSTGNGTMNLFSISTSSPIFDVLANGNVGIGTTTPPDRLSIGTGGLGIAGNGSTNGIIFDRGSNNELGLYKLGTNQMTVGSSRFFANSFQFHGNTADTSGMYQPIAGDLSLMTGSTDRLRITSAGNVGIGSTTPGAKLSVNGDGYFGGNLTATGTLTVNGFVNTGTAAFTTLTSTGTSTFATAGGNVGIGTTNPTQKLDVTGNIITSGPSTTTNAIYARGGDFAGNWLYAGMIGGTAGADINSSYVKFGTYLNGPLSERSYIALTAGGNLGIGTTTPGARLTVASSTATGTALMFAVNSVSGSLFNILANGNVGIGTTTPQAVLHVNEPISLGDNAFMVTDSTATGGYFKVTDGSSIANHFVPTISSKAVGLTGINRTGLLVSAEPGFDDAANSAIVLQGKLNAAALVNSPVLSVQNNTTNLLTVLANGNVGIGTNAARAALDINGLISSSAITNFFSVANISTSTDTIAGMEMRNTSSGTNADFRFVISDNGAPGSSGNYIAFAAPSNTNTSTLFGQPRSAILPIFTNVATGNTGAGRMLALGTVNNNDVLFASNNTERMRITAAGNVGIGTTTPGTALEVNGKINTSNAGSASVGDVNAGSLGFYTYGTGGRYIRMSTNGAVNDLLGNGAPLVLNFAGGQNVGIGTTLSPGSKLAVMGNLAVGVPNGTVAPVDGALFGGSVGIGTTSPSSALSVVGAGIFQRNSIGTTTTDGLVLTNDVAAALGAPQYSPRLRFHGTGWDATNSTQKTTDVYMEAVPGSYPVTASGQTNPTFRISQSVNGAAPFAMVSFDQFGHFYTTGNISSSGGSLSSGNGTVSASRVAGFGTTSSDGIFTNTANATAVNPVQISLRFRLNSNAWDTTAGASRSSDWIMESLPVSGSSVSSTYRIGNNLAGGAYSYPFVITSAGNVGIGTTTPGSKLSVAGDVNITGALQANGNPGTSGQVLQATGTGFQWVATSSLGISSISGGTEGYVARFISPTAISTGILLDTGLFAGVNATSSSYTFNLQGSAGVNPFNVASSTGTSLFSVLQNGNVGIGTTTASTKFAIQNASTSAQDLLSFYRSDGLRIGGFSNQAGFTNFFQWANNGGNTYNFSIDGNGFVSAPTARVGAGSSASPSWSFNSDQDTGVYNPSANTLGFSTAGINRLTIGSNGNVGIGVSTSTPTAMLTVSSSTGNGTMNLFSISTSSPIFDVLANGNVGIGTTTPQAQLSVAGQTILGGGVLSPGASKLTIVHGTSEIGLAIRRTNANAYSYFEMFNESNAAAFRLNENSQLLIGEGMDIGIARASPGNLSFVNNGTSTYWTIGTGGIQAGADNIYDIGASATGRARDIWIARNALIAGNVGIGTTTPGSRLTVDGDGFFGGNLTATGTLTLTATSTSSIAGGLAVTATSTFAQTAGSFLAIGTTTNSFSAKLNLQGLMNIGTANSSFGGLGIININGNTWLAASSTANNFCIGNTTGCSARGTENIAIGAFSMGLTPTGSNNIAIGRQTLYQLTSGSSNTAIGHASMLRALGSSETTAIGAGALYYAGTSTRVTALGVEAGMGNSANGFTNQGGVYVGYRAGYSAATSSDYNTFLGYQAGYDNTTGANNIVIGPWTTGGVGVTTGTNNILIGSGVRAGLSQTGSNQLNIGNLIFATSLGSSTAMSAGNVGIGTSTPGSLLSVSSSTATGTAGLFSVSASSPVSNFTVLANGNVGIGVAAPGHRLTIQQSDDTQAVKITASSTSNYLNMYLNASGNPRFESNGSMVFDTNTYGVGGIYFRSGSSVGTLFNDISPRATNFNNGQLHLTATGNLGIGTTTPNAPLTVVSTSTGVIQSWYSGTTSTSTVLTLSSVNNGGLGYDALLQSPFGIRLSGQDSSTQARFTTSGGSSYLQSTNFVYSGLLGAPGTNVKFDYATANFTGNVGIGTTTPGSKLSVAGDINATGTYMINGAVIAQASTTLNNYFFGQAGNQTATGTGNIAMGYQAGLNITAGIYNSFIGYQTGRSTTNGQYNSFVGTLTGYNNTSGSNNAMYGALAGNGNIGGSNNSFLGYAAGQSNSTGNMNVYVGMNAGILNNGSNNTFVGVQSGGTSAGSNSTLLGYRAGSNMATSTGNLYLGYQAASTTIGDYNILLGFNNNLASTTGSNQLNIGNLIYGTNLGINGVASTGNVGIGTTTPGSTLTVAGTIGITGQINSTDTSGAFINNIPAGTSPRSIRMGNSGNDVYFGSEGSTAGGFFPGSLAYSSVIYSSNSIQHIIGGSSKMIVTTAGNVGIGTTTPQRKLDIADATNPQLRLSYNGSTYTDIQTQSDGFLHLNPSGGRVILDPAGGYMDVSAGTLLLGANGFGTTGDILFRSVGAPSTVVNPVFAMKDSTGSRQDGLRFNHVWNNSTPGALDITMAMSSLGTNIMIATSTASSTNLGFYAASTSFTGSVAIGTSTPGSKLDLWSTTSSSNVDMFRIGTNVGSSNNIVFRIDSDGDLFSDGALAIGSPADIAESYAATEAVDAGTVVAFATTTTAWSATKGSDVSAASSTDVYEISGVRKAHDQYEAVGIVSTKAGLHLGADIVNGVPVALSGRVPVKVTTENGPVMRGDYITVSATRPGYAMKLTGEGRALGRALSDSSAGNDKVMVFIENGYQKVDMAGRHATTTGMLTTGNVDLNANGVAITNIKSLASANGAWSISEDGRIIAKMLCLEDVCIDKNQLTNILNSTGQSGSASTGAVAGTSTQATSTESGTAAATATTTDSGTASAEGAPASEPAPGATQEEIPPAEPVASVDQTPEAAPSTPPEEPSA